MNPQKKFTTQRQAEAQQQQALGQEQTQSSAPLEFASPEEMLRHDALHTPVPPSIAWRLKESVGREPPRPPWWRRWLGA